MMIMKNIFTIATAAESVYPPLHSGSQAFNSIFNQIFSATFLFLLFI